MPTQQRERVRPPRQPDASMSLLNQLFENPLDEGYTQAAARRAAVGEHASPGRRPLGSIALAAGLLGLGLLLTLAVLQVQQEESAVSAERESLVEQIDAVSARTSELEEVASSLEEDITELQANALQNAAAMEELRSSMQSTQVAVGATAVTGPGLVVELRDAEPGSVADSDVDEDFLEVFDADLQQVVNGLWAAGAEAIGVNGERIMPTTAIRSVNDVVLVNLRPLPSPYEVTAIGDPDELSSRFVEGPGFGWLQNEAAPYGIQFEIETHESLTLPGGAPSVEVARP